MDSDLIFGTETSDMLSGTGADDTQLAAAPATEAPYGDALVRPFDAAQVVIPEGQNVVREPVTPGEIVEQIVIVLNDVYGIGAETPHGTNLVAMGAGEPFLNFENLIKALEIMSDENGLFIVPGRVTVSTAGIVPKIRAFTALDRRPNLAISLSAANDELRDVLMPINRRWNIDELMSAAKEFERTLKRGERFTFEYVLLGGVNDSDEHAVALAELLRRHDLRRVKINLIAHNPAPGLDYHPPDAERVHAFKQTLESRGVSAYLRTPRGRDIYAACGQLAAKQEPNLVQIVGR